MDQKECNSVVSTRVPAKSLTDLDSDDSMYAFADRTSWRELGSVRTRGELERARKYRVNQNLAWTVVAEPQGISVQQVDHDREKRIGDESEVWIGG